MKDNQTSLDNTRLIAQVTQLESEIKELQDSLQKAKEFIDIDAIKAPINLYIVGKYIGFNQENGLIELIVEGNKYFYTLDSYGSSRLPFPDSRVLVFNIENRRNKPYVLGFDGGRMIQPSPYYAATLVAINLINSQLTLHTQEYGNITLFPSKNFLQNKNLRDGETLLIREVNYATKKYFLLNDDKQNNKLDNNKMYTFLSTLIN